VSYKLRAALRSSLVPELGPLPTSFTRNLAAYVVDFEGLLKLAPANCARFTGARFVQNQLLNSSLDFWTAGVPNNCTRGASATFTQIAGWNGTGSALRFSATNGGNVGNNRVNFILPAALIVGRKYVISARVRRNNAGTGALRYAIDSTGTFDLAPAAGVDGAWRRFAAAPITILTANGNFGFYPNAAGEEFDIDDVQYEDITGQSNTNPSEYINNGTGLAFPYQGAGADGVQFFDYANGNLVNNAGVVTAAQGPAPQRFLTLTGINGSKASYPGTGLHLAGAFEVRAKLAPAVWGHASIHQAVVGMLVTNTLGSIEWKLEQLNASQGQARLNLQLGLGAGNANHFSTAAVPNVGNGVAAVVRAVITDGGQNHTVTFGYSSDEGATWTQIGAPVTAAGALSSIPTVTNARVYVGQFDQSNATTNLTGNVYWAEIRDGSGNLMLRMDPQADAALTGWTNGAAVGATFTAAALKGYRKERAAQNLAKSSTDFRSVAEGNANGIWTTTTGTTIGASITAPDGSLTMQKIQEDATNGPHMRDGAIAITADATFSESVYLKAAERAFAFFSYYNGSNSVTGYVNLTTGDVTNITVNGTAALVSATTEALPGGVWRLKVTASIGSGLTACSVQYRIATAAGTNSYAGTAGSGIYLWMHQFEQSAGVTSPIPTTNVTVTRPEDKLAYAVGVNDVTGTAYARFEPDSWADASINGGAIVGDSALTSPRALQALTNFSGAGSYDGTGNSNAPLGAAAGAIMGATTWDAVANRRRSYANGVGGTETVYDGAFGIANVGIGYGGQSFQGNIRDVVLLDTALSEFDVPKLPNYVYPTLADPIAGACSYPPLQAGMVNAPVLLGSITQPVAIVGVVK
jgi:hypothetical protein